MLVALEAAEQAELLLADLVVVVDYRKAGGAVGAGYEGLRAGAVKNVVRTVLQYSQLKTAAAGADRSSSKGSSKIALTVSRGLRDA